MEKMKIKGGSATQTAYPLHLSACALPFIAAVYLIPSLHPNSNWPCVQVSVLAPFKWGQPTSGVTGFSMSHWTRTWLRDLRVQRPTTGRWAVSQQLPDPYCRCTHTPQVNISPGPLERRKRVEKQHLSAACVYTGAREGTALSPQVDLWLATGLLFLLCVDAHCVQVCTQVLLWACGYRVTAALDPLDWEGKNPPRSQRPGDSAATNKVKKPHRDTGKNTPVEFFSWSRIFIYFHIHLRNLSGSLACFRHVVYTQNKRNYFIQISVSLHSPSMIKQE